jgi:Tfp pilus assembly protein PilV
MKTDRGFSLVEAMVATVIAVIAILGLAFTFGQGRGLIDQYETSRAATAAAQGCMDSLAVLPPADPALSLGAHAAEPFVIDGQPLGTVAWDVTPFTDPVAGGSTLKKVVVTVAWQAGSSTGSLQLSKLILAP